MSHFDGDPYVEDAEYAWQPPSDTVVNPPTSITIKGVRYAFYAVSRQIKGGPKDGQTEYLVSLPGDEKMFFINSMTGEQKEWKGFRRA